MKKIAPLALALILSCALFLTFFPTTALATAQTPFSDSSLKVAVVENFDADSYDVYLGYPDGLADPLPAGLSFAGGEFLIGQGERGAWATVGASALETFDASGAIGYGLYIKSTSETDINSNFPLVSGGLSQNNGKHDIAANKEYVLVDKETKTETVVTTTATTANPYSKIVIPAGFEGYLLIPFTSSAIDAATTFSGIGWEGCWDSSAAGFDTGSIHIDNLFFYGSGVTAQDADLILGTVPTPSPEPTAEPTGTTAVSPTDKGGNTGVADFSLLLYAVAALGAGGAFIAFKKK